MTIRELILGLLKDLGSAFMPFSCHHCRASTDFGVVLCPDCQTKLATALHAPRLVEDTRCDFRVYTMSNYNSIVSDMIRIVKYRPSPRLLKILVASCQKNGQLKTLLKPDDLVVAVPMHSARLCERGFNQAAEIAAGLAITTGCQCLPILQRVRATRPQADCNEEERSDNLKDAFGLDNSLQIGNISNKRIILVDDVATTGSTLQLCANKLKELKPAEICALVVSHSYRQKPAADNPSANGIASSG
ncbi:MAG: hypothetical protein GQF41_0537 [Candidatus Rifleibacterium amylolyticum]|nr:MAG: hypothetical protein GQF41_0537 [Candidatus Rifleibacterium amylolyticum]